MADSTVIGVQVAEGEIEDLIVFASSVEALSYADGFTDGASKYGGSALVYLEGDANHLFGDAVGRSDVIVMARAAISEKREELKKAAPRVQFRCSPCGWTGNELGDEDHCPNCDTGPGDITDYGPGDPND